ncbi:MAG: hypothetical protein H3Z52_10580 [archaeon]|nr:hypothetical protein [archaeon]MCP8321366.1 hypothetical protein [archaeon]
MRDNYDIERFLEQPVLRKLQIIYDASLCTFLLRHKEETRGGEYIELAYLVITSKKSEKVWFLKKEGILISTMVKELLDEWKINMRTYSNVEELIEEATRIVRYRLIEARSKG